MEETPYMDENTALALVEQIEAHINKACTESMYTHLCARIKTDGGMTYAVNRCIQMMAKDKIKLSAAMAQLESELEGVN